jgi:hypothetical protein
LSKTSIALTVLCVAEIVGTGSPSHSSRYLPKASKDATVAHWQALRMICELHGVQTTALIKLDRHRQGKDHQ